MNPLTAKSERHYHCRASSLASASDEPEEARPSEYRGIGSGRNGLILARGDRERGWGVRRASRHSAGTVAHHRRCRAAAGTDSIARAGALEQGTPWARSRPAAGGRGSHMRHFEQDCPRSGLRAQSTPWSTGRAFAGATSAPHLDVAKWHGGSAPSCPALWAGKAPGAKHHEVHRQYENDNAQRLLKKQWLGRSESGSTAMFVSALPTLRRSSPPDTDGSL